MAHPTYYLNPNDRRNETCYSPTPAKIYSWHIHVLYWQSNEEDAKGARLLRENFRSAFEGTLGQKECNSTFHMENLCLFADIDKPDGPFLTAQWAVFVPIDHFYSTVSWIMQNRNGYDVLVHPNSGCEIEDHSWWAFWGGNPWQINFDAFSYDYPFPWTKEMEDKADPVLDPSNSAPILISENENSILANTFLKEHPDH